MRIDEFLVAFVVFSVIVVTGVLLIGDLNTNYNLDIDTSDFNETYNTIDTMYNLSQDMKEKTIDADISDEESWESMAKGSYSALRLTKDTFGLVGDIINQVAKQLGVPAYMVTFALTVVTIVLIFAIILLVMGVVNRRS